MPGEGSKRPETTIKLVEYDRQSFSWKALPHGLGEELWPQYKDQVSVEFPSPKTGGQWELTAQGWVGYIPLADGWQVVLEPKVALDNLFRMLEYAYRIKFEIPEDQLIGCATLQEFYERLARILASRIVDRGRKGFYREYISQADQLPYVRGRMDVVRVARAPWDVQVHCQFQEHTADIEDNQLLVWTVYCIARSGLCTERVLPVIRRAYRELQGITSLNEFGPEACLKRLYTRLNEDYRPLHGLCRFFLEHSGPSRESGDHSMVPFLVDMARLYEAFVAEWLRVHLPASLNVKVQERVIIGKSGSLHFQIDLVLYDTASGKVICVLDTKYKKADEPRTDDIAQVVAYAEAKGCTEAVLVYPASLTRPLDTCIGGIRVRTLVFKLDGDLEMNGKSFLQQITA